MLVKKGTMNIKQGDSLIGFYPETDVESVDGLEERLSELENANYTEIFEKANTAYNKATGLEELLLFPMTPIEMISDPVIAADGTVKSPTFAYVDIQRVDITGITSASEPGEYETIFTPKSEQFVWSDTNTTGARKFTWSIVVMSDPTISVSSESVLLNSYSKLTETIIVTTNSTGNIVATSSNENVATVAVDGTNVVLTYVNGGSAKVTITVEANGIYNSISTEVSVKAVLGFNGSDFTDAESAIAAIKDGTAWNIMEVGDRFPVVLNGTITEGTTEKLKFNNETVYAVLLGFDHNKDKEGEGLAHFILGQTDGGIDIAFGSFQHYSDNEQGNTSWIDKSFIRNNYLKQFKDCMELDVKNEISKVRKYTAALGGSDREMLPAMEELFLLSEVEIFGKQTYASTNESNYCKQYDYYKNGNSTRRYNSASPTSSVRWWERSPWRGDNRSSYGFCRVHTDGGANSDTSYNSCALAPAFCVSKN